MPNSEVLLMRLKLTGDIPRPVSLRAGFNIVPFNENKHAQAARELLNTAYREGGGDILSLDQWWPVLITDPEFDQELLFVLIEEGTGKMLAFAQVWSSGFIKDFAVIPPAQRKGIGRALLSHIVQTLRERGLPDCTLKVLSDNPTNAPEFYRANGMEVVEQL